jgi:hypothetical protein
VPGADQLVVKFDDRVGRKQIENPSKGRLAVGRL